MITKTFQGCYDYTNERYLDDTEISVNAIRSLFAAIQMGKGESDGDNIRMRRRFVSCTVEGMTYEYSNKGRKATVTHRTYDSVVTLEGQDEAAFQVSLYWRPE